MNKFTEAALKDVRYKVHPYRTQLVTHPKEWFESYGFKTPVRWKTHSCVRAKAFEEKLYPHYTKDYGWEWVTETKHNMILERYANRSI